MHDQSRPASRRSLLVDAGGSVQLALTVSQQSANRHARALITWKKILSTELLEGEPFTLGDLPSDMLIAWVLLTLSMAGYWFWRFRPSGVLTFDVFFIGLYLYLPIVGMALFAYSPLNSFSTGDWHWRYLPQLHEAFYVSLFGAAAFLLSAAVASRWDSAPPGYRSVYRAIHDFWGCRACGEN